MPTVLRVEARERAGWEKESPAVQSPCKQLASTLHEAHK